MARRKPAVQINRAFPRQPPWMSREDYDRFCGFCLVAELYYEALNTKDRAGWLMLARISKRISDGPWHFFDWKKGQDQ